MTGHNFVILEIRNADADWSPAAGTRSLKKAEELEELEAFLAEKTGRSEPRDPILRSELGSNKITLADGGDPDA